VLTPGQLASAARAIQIVLTAPGPAAQVASSPDDPGSFTEDFDSLSPGRVITAGGEVLLVNSPFSIYLAAGRHTHSGVCER
jgi:hypothetical protein